MRIGLTQRVVVDPRHGERRDALDQRWMPVLDALGALPVVLPNAVSDPEGYVRRAGLDGAILTGGNNVDAPAGAADAAPERDVFEHALIDWCATTGLPLVGVCRGFQMLHHHAHGRLRPMTGHAGTRHTLTWADEVPEDLRSPVVNSFHDFGIAADELSGDYEPLAWAEGGTVEAAAHRKHPWLAIMWHPEREPDLRASDLRLLRQTLAGAVR